MGQQQTYHSSTRTVIPSEGWEAYKVTFFRILKMIDDFVQEEQLEQLDKQIKESTHDMNHEYLIHSDEKTLKVIWCISDITGKITLSTVYDRTETSGYFIGSLLK